MSVSLVFLALVSVTFAKTDFAALSSGSAATSLKQRFVGVPFTNSESSEVNGYSYYGIRYGNAKRFEHATMNSDHSYLNNPERPKQGYQCPQVPTDIPGFSHRNLVMDEDCLYLDVYVPPVTKNQKETFPVMFWIHGGGFVTDINAVVVTVNYRLGAFGFLSTGDDLAKGNWAIGDIKLALQWTRKNIEAFGGDPEKITIFGESAGGALTSVLMLDDHIRETVLAAVALSGSALAGWADYTHSAAQNVRTEATQLECPAEPLSAAVTCLKTVPFEKFIAPRSFLKAGLGISFGPVIDGVHIKGHPLITIPKSTKSLKREATFITTFLKEDASFLLYVMMPDIFVPGNFSFSVFQHILGAFLPHTAACSENQQVLVGEIFSHYKVSQTDDEKTLLRKLFTVVTDIMFGYPSIKESIVYASRSFSDSTPNYQVIISHDPKYRDWGAFHGVDLVLIFRGIMDQLMDGVTPDPTATASFRNLLRDLAYTGKPADFPPFANDRSFSNLKQNGKFVKDSQDFEPLIKLWDKVFQFRCPEIDADPEKMLIKTEL